MLALGFLGWLIVGALIGWAVVRVTKATDQQAVSRNLGLGVLGGVVGGFIVALASSGTHTATMLCSLVGAAIGAVVVNIGGRAVLARNPRFSRKV